MCICFDMDRIINLILNNHSLFLKIRHTNCFLLTTEHSSVSILANFIYLRHLVFMFVQPLPDLLVVMVLIPGSLEVRVSILNIIRVINSASQPSPPSPYPPPPRPTSCSSRACFEWHFAFAFAFSLPGFNSIY